MFFIYSESHLVERTNLSAMPNGHGCGFGTKATGANRKLHTSVDGSWEGELCPKGSAPVQSRPVRPHSESVSWNPLRLGHLSARDKREPRKVEGSAFCLVRLGNRLAFPSKWSLA